ncbi:MAG: DegT/DnrJ/EryC1/StrS family aminotransferase, partial [Bacteroidetes bacterium]|nr:DegT/DnrJ/EryC1/StrS family aminotransferase [Bacteroidota bacterium]
QRKRGEIWNAYYVGLEQLERKALLLLPRVQHYSTNNFHIFYLVLKSLDERTNLIAHLKKNNISAVFHYLSLHKSLYYADKYSSREHPNADLYSDRLLRLPLHCGLSAKNVQSVIDCIKSFWA